VVAVVVDVRVIEGRGVKVMSAFAMEGQLRSGHGKGASRRLRAAEQVPAIVYGQGHGALSVSVSPKALTKALTGALRRNQLIELSLKGADGKDAGKKLVLVKDLQAHPVRRTPTHVDFLEVKIGQPVVARVPVEVTGKSKAAVAGARTQLCSRDIAISASPDAIPAKIVLDTTECDFGVVRAKAVPLPAGVSLACDPEFPVVSLRMPRGEKDEAAEAAPAAAAAPAAGAAAAPAAAKKDDKKK
jgi:large subunit ribosomal protein L25